MYWRAGAGLEVGCYGQVLCKSSLVELFSSGRCARRAQKGPSFCFGVTKLSKPDRTVFRRGWDAVLLDLHPIRDLFVCDQMVAKGNLAKPQRSPIQIIVELVGHRHHLRRGRSVGDVLKVDPVLKWRISRNKRRITFGSRANFVVGVARGGDICLVAGSWIAWRRGKTIIRGTGMPIGWRRLVGITTTFVGIARTRVNTYYILPCRIYLVYRVVACVVVKVDRETNAFDTYESAWGTDGVDTGDSAF